MSLSIVNWNVEFATPRSWRAPEISEPRWSTHGPEIVCLTETHDELLVSIMATRSARSRTMGTRPKKNRRKVSALVEGTLDARSMIWDGSTRCRRDGLCRAITRNVGGRGCGHWDLHPLVRIADRGSARERAQEAVAGSRAVPGRPYRSARTGGSEASDRYGGLQSGYRAGKPRTA